MFETDKAQADLKRRRRDIHLRLFFEGTIAGALILIMIAAFVYLHCHCWFRLGPIEVIKGYYIEGDKRIDLGQLPGKRTVGNKDILLGVELSLKRKCYCPDGDIYAEIHNFQPGVLVPWEEIRLGGEYEQLLPRNDKATILEGAWVKLPPGLYLVELELKCSSRPESIPIKFATFKKEE